MILLLLSLELFFCGFFNIADLLSKVLIESRHDIKEWNRLLLSLIWIEIQHLLLLISQYLFLFLGLVLLRNETLLHNWLLLRFVLWGYAIFLYNWLIYLSHFFVDNKARYLINGCSS